MGLPAVATSDASVLRRRVIRACRALAARAANRCEGGRSLTLAAVVCAAAHLAAGSQGGPRTEEIVKRATAYVERYAAELKFVLADEEYSQRTFDGTGALARQRRMRGELYLAFLPADDVWIAVHDVSEVDGIAVTDRDELRALLRQGEVTSVARRVADRNASFNIGSVSRNFNEPTLPLLLLTSTRVSRSRFRAVSTVAGTVTLAFEERERPTLVRSRSGAHVFSRGVLTVDAETGRIEATAFELSDGDIRVRLETTYASNDKLGLWMPTTFTETYERPGETIRCNSLYSNYRRFEVIGRIK